MVAGTLALAGLFVHAPRCDADFIFGEPTKIPNVSVPGAGGPQISRDGLEFYFTRDSDEDCQDLWIARRSSVGEEWSTPVRLEPPVNSPYPVGGPCLSPDGLELYFSDGMPMQYEAMGCVPDPSGYGGGDIWVTRRATNDSAWDDPINLGPPVNTSNYEDHPCLTSDGLTLFFTSDRSGSATLWMASRPAIDAPWGQPQRLGPPIDMWMFESTPFMSPDGLSLYFSYGGWKPDIHVSKRTSVTAPWGPPVRFEPVNSPEAEYHLSFAEGDPMLYFTRGTGFIGNYDVWQVEAIPIADFNDDKVVDVADMSSLLEHWGQKNSLYDIGPRPLGDGRVDGEDLTVFCEQIAYDETVPTPGYGEKDVAAFAGLRWTASPSAQAYDVYLGTSLAEVDSASRMDPMGALVSMDQSANTYDVEGPLDFGQTYYWRVDEVNSLSHPSIIKGMTWHFTTEAAPGPIDKVLAMASSAEVGAGPEHTIDRSGLSSDDLHDIATGTMWLSAAGGPQPTWIQYDFDTCYPLDAMWVWNYNSQFEKVLGMGCKEVTIEYSDDGTTWTTLDDVQLARATSQSDYLYNTVVHFDGVVARSVRLTIRSNWGGMSPQYGLSEVRFFYLAPETKEGQSTSH